MYSVTAASRLSGVPPDTLRAWERRYELVHPRRDGCGRRAYSEEDVERLRLLRLATELGHPIRRLAELGVDELRVMVEQSGVENGNGDEMARLVSRVLGAVERYRVDECDEVLGLAATLLDVDQLVHKVLSPILTEVGQRWHRGELGVSQERMISASVGRTVSSMLATFRRRTQGPTMLLATLPGERHELGLLLTALLAAREGLDCLYLGSDIPAPELAVAAQRTAARCIGLSIVLDPQADTVHEDLDGLARAIPGDCEIWMGGAGVRALDAGRLPCCCRVLSEPSELKALARALMER